MSIVKIPDFTGGYNSAEPTTIADNELQEVINMFYDEQKILTTRRGISTFGGAIAGVSGIHSAYYTRFTDGTRYLLVGAGTDVYKYDEGAETFNSIQTGLTDNARLSFFTYKDVISWCNGIDDFTSYDGTTVTTDAAVPKGKYFAVQNVSVALP